MTDAAIYGMTNEGTDKLFILRDGIETGTQPHHNPRRNENYYYAARMKGNNNNIEINEGCVML